MKLNISKEWFMRMAKLEGDSEIGAGAVARDPVPEQQLVDYRDLPDEVMAHLKALEDFIGDVDGKDTVMWAGDHETCIDDGTIDAECAVKAFNGIVAYLRTIANGQAEQKA